MNLSHRIIYCGLVCLGGYILYLLLSQVFELYPGLAIPGSLFLQEIDFIDKWLVLSIFLITLLLTELGSIAYSMYKIRKLPKIIKEESGYSKVTGRKEKSKVPASKSEILAFNIMDILKSKPTPDDSLDIDLCVEDDEKNESGEKIEKFKHIWSNVRAYTLGMETAAGGRHAICLNSGSIEQMPIAYVAAIMAHEMGHVKNQDTATKIFMGCFRGFVSFVLLAPLHILYAVLVALSWLFSFIPFLKMFALLFSFITALMIGLVRFLEILVMWPAYLYELHISRRSEYRADAVAAEYGPSSICRVLNLMKEYCEPKKNNRMLSFQEKLQIAHSTHPPFEDRIRAIQNRTYAK